MIEHTLGGLYTLLPRQPPILNAFSTLMQT
jgi:hypothetical protein